MTPESIAESVDLLNSEVHDLPYRSGLANLKRGMAVAAPRDQIGQLSCMWRC